MLICGQPFNINQEKWRQTMNNKHYETPKLLVFGIKQQDVITASVTDPTLNDIYGDDDIWSLE